MPENIKKIIKKQATGFTQIANKLLNDSTISLKAKGLYAYIYSKPDGWQFSTRRIPADHKDGRDAVLSGIEELEENHYLKREKHGDGRVTYHVLVDPKSENPTQALHHPVSENPTVGKPHSGKTRHISNKEVKVIKSNSNKDINHQFEKFWKAYPRKVAKKTALRAWTKLNPDQNLFNDIIGGLEDYKKTQAWQKDGGSFIPHPTTFLNQERYYDEIVPQKEIQQRPVRLVQPTRPPLTENQKQKMATIRSGSSNLAEKMRM